MDSLLRAAGSCPGNNTGPPAGRWEGAGAHREAMGALPARGVAHDLNNLLTLILGHAELALGDPQPERHHSALEQIAQAAGLGASLTRRLLHADGEGERVPRPVSVNRVARNALDIFQPLLPPNILVKADLEPALWPVAADEVGLVEVLVNLLDNAREAMPNGGTLTVATENILVADGDRQAPGRPDCGLESEIRNPKSEMARACVCLTVADTGVGVQQGCLDRIFEPHFTTKRDGTGLGLAVARRIVEQHGGWIAVTSESGRGASFSVFLPACSPPAGAQEALSA